MRRHRRRARRQILPLVACLVVTTELDLKAETVAPRSTSATSGEPATGPNGLPEAPPLRTRPAPPVAPGRLFAFLAALRQAATTWAFAEPERARSLLFRARAAPWLPELRVRIDRRFGRTESLDAGATTLPSDTTTPVGLDTIDDVRYELRATWDLARLVFNPDEVQASSQALRMADVRREIESLVIKLFMERLRLLRTHRLGAPDVSRDVAPAKELRRLEIEAELDALTGGLFSRLTGDPMEVMVPSDERSPSR